MPSHTAKHFLTLSDLSIPELTHLLQRARKLKRMLRDGICYEPLKNRVMAMIFEKSSTRTRVSFESAMTHFGGHALFLSRQDTQLGRGEPVEDTARVLSSMVDVIMVRTFAHNKLQKLAEYSSVPVINGLTDDCHPCQLLADLLTYIENRDSIQGKTVAYLGDGNNMCNSYIEASTLFQFNLRIACPVDYQPKHDLLAKHSNARLVATPQECLDNADLVVTDVWASMGQEQEASTRKEIFMPYQVNQSLMNLAKPDALFMHCLPAHRGEEVTEEVLEGPQSVVWQEAENRLHAQKALLELLLVGIKD